MRYKVKIESLDHQGRGIAKIDGRVVFIPEILPNEEAEILLTVDKKRYAEGRIISLDVSSEKRCTPLCPCFSSCGGCDLMHISYEDELKFKEEKVKSIISRYASCDGVVKEIIKSKELNYRNKVKLRVNNKVGFLNKKSNDLLVINECFISSLLINKIIKRLNTLDLQNIDVIEIKVNDKDDECLILLYFNNTINEQVFLNEFTEENINIIALSSNLKKIIKGKDYLINNVGDKTFKCSYDSFFQVNFDGALKLYNKVKELCKINKNDKILDLYCGTGTLGLYVVENSSELLGVDVVENAIKDAKENAKLNNITSSTFKCIDLKNGLNNLDFIPDIVLLDPPRNGLDKQTTEDILKLNALRIIYVSCDPMTLARDLNILKEKYNIESITPLDMFPRTYHVETITELTKK